MATTYSQNSDLVLYNGISVDDPEHGFFISGLSQSEKDALMDRARLKAYNFINDKYLKNKTALPATHIPGLKEIETDLVISYLIRDSHVQETMNQSEWEPKYQQAVEALKTLEFDASNNAPVADGENVGNGALVIYALNDDFTKTERWLFVASNASQFHVRGSVSGVYPTLTVNKRYPEKSWTTLGISRDYGFTTFRPIWSEYPFYIEIQAGTIPFVQNDKFTLETFASNSHYSAIGKIRRE
jgi:hypothetical protein